MERISLFEEFRLIERSESEVNVVWKGAHLLLFFLAFVFGSFCTFCFHMLMYLFDEKCVLFPKLLSLTTLRHNVIYEFIPEEKEKAEMLPVDFLSTKWVEKSACYLPTYIPLMSAIFGLVWTTMFLMCSSGSRSLTGLQRPWRVILPVLVFSLVMGGICIHSSVITHTGLRDLCVKLGKMTGSSTCSYTVNVATLVYERKIRGVYQATRLTITSAWLHTCCWLASALLALARILLAVDFRLVRVKVELVGNVDKMMERNEQQLRTISPHHGNDDDKNLNNDSDISMKVFYQNEQFGTLYNKDGKFEESNGDILFISQRPAHISESSLVPEERNKLIRRGAYQHVRKDHHFIVNILYDLLDAIAYAPEYKLLKESSPISIEDIGSSEDRRVTRQFGQQTISSRANRTASIEAINANEAEEVFKEIKLQLLKTLNRQLIELPIHDHSGIHSDPTTPSTSKKKGRITFESSLNITPEMRQALNEKSKHPKTDQEEKPERKLSILSSEEVTTENTEQKEKLPEEPLAQKKSNIKSDPTNMSVQTKKKRKKTKPHKVTISESRSKFIEEIEETEGSSDSTEPPNKKPKKTQD